MLSPGSRGTWEALRARAVDDTRGDVSDAEAFAWFRNGAPSSGFPFPTPEEIVSREFGVETCAALAAADAAVMTIFLASLFGDGKGKIYPFTPEKVAAMLAQWLAPACAAYVALALPRRARLGSKRVSANEACRWRIAVAAAASTVFVWRLTASDGDRGNVMAQKSSAGVALRSACVALQALSAPAGSLMNETLFVFLGACATLPLIWESRLESTLDFKIAAGLASAAVAARAVAALARRCVADVAACVDAGARERRAEKKRA